MNSERIFFAGMGTPQHTASPAFRLLLKLILAISLTAVSPVFASGEKFVLLSHAADSDTWWDTVKNAIQQAGEDFNVSVDYRHPPTGDMLAMAHLIDQAAAGHYDGIVSTIGDAGVQAALKRVVAKHIPLITINSGTQQQSEQLGALMHVGQPEYEAGIGAGVRARASGIKSFVCVNTFAQSPVSFERCRGFAEAIGIADYMASTLVVGADAVSVDSKLTAWLLTHPDTQAVLALGPDGASAALKTLGKMGLKDRIWFATFDLSDAATQAIKDGSMKFAIDQQPYLQGYLPIAVMAIMQREKITDLKRVMEILRANPKCRKRFEEYGLTPLYGPRHISSGPGFVTRSNVVKVEKYAGRYR